PATVGARVAAEFVDTDGVPSVQWKIARQGSSHGTA
ncbi:MAG: hypothetical protein QOE94_375, partial [Mycobacterium sp.]|nr:hypothetical protein [Mycobacterium sp.]